MASRCGRWRSAEEASCWLWRRRCCAEVGSVPRAASRLLRPDHHRGVGDRFAEVRARSGAQSFACCKSACDNIGHHAVHHARPPTNMPAHPRRSTRRAHDRTITPHHRIKSAAAARRRQPAQWRADFDRHRRPLAKVMLFQPTSSPPEDGEPPRLDLGEALAKDLSFTDPEQRALRWPSR